MILDKHKIKEHFWGCPVQISDLFSGKQFFMP